MTTKSTIAKSILFLLVKVGEIAEGKDVFKKVRIGFLDSKASDDALINSKTIITY